MSHSLQKLQQVLKIDAICCRKHPPYTKCDKLEELIRVKFYQRLDQSQFTLDSFTKELVSNASAQLFLDNTLSSFTNFSPHQLMLERQWEVSISQLCYQKVTKGKFIFLDENFSKSSELYQLESGFHPTFTDIVEALDTLIQKRHKYSESYISVKLSRRTQKVEIYLAKEGSGLAFFDADLKHIFGIIVGEEIIVMLRGKNLTNQNYDNLCIDSLMIYTDLIE